MIVPFFGVFLQSPCPLEMALNVCSHKCAMCFANLNQPNRRADVKAIDSLLVNHQDRTTLVARLLQDRRPVLISNHVDPFAANNWRQAVPLIKTMAGLGIPMAFQTRGGTGWQEVLDYIKPSCWYVSINQLDDSLRKKLEPGAPPIESRFELIAELIRRGHSVQLGANPLVKEWLPEPEALLDRLYDLGVRCAWFQCLHFNYTQRNNMPARDKENLTADVIQRAMKRKRDPEWTAHVERAMFYARITGWQVYEVGNVVPSEYFSDFYRLYDGCFPTYQMLVNKCFAGELGPLVTFRDACELLLPRLPDGVYDLDHYVGATSHDLMWKYKIPKWMTYRQLLGVLWTYDRCKANPSQSPLFARATRFDGAEAMVCEEHGLPVYRFIPETTNDYWMDAGDLEGVNWVAA